MLKVNKGSESVRGSKNVKWMYKADLDTCIMVSVAMIRQPPFYGTSFKSEVLYVILMTCIVLFKFRKINSIGL